MNTARHLPQENLALFALQLLEGDELRDALDHLELCEECRHQVARYQGDLSGYALALSEIHSPPARARERLLKAVAREKKVVPPERPVAPLRRSSTAIPIAQDFQTQAPHRNGWAEEQPGLRYESGTAHPAVDGELFLSYRGRRDFETATPKEEARPARRASGAASFLGWAGWAVATGLAVIAGLQYRERQNLQGDVQAVTARLAEVNSHLVDAHAALQTLTDQNAMQVALHLPVNGQPQAPEPSGHAAYNAEQGALVFIGSHLQPLQAAKTYELWLIPIEGDPIPAGTFKPDARGVATVVMPALPKGIAAKGFGVTVENDGGSQKPTPPVVLAGM